MDYQITQGELRQARVQLPAGQKLLRVEGQEIRTWEITNENGAQVLVVDLLKGVPLNWRLTIETETVLDALPANATVETPHALDVKRENGLVALRGTEGAGVVRSDRHPVWNAWTPGNSGARSRMRRPNRHRVPVC